MPEPDLIQLFVEPLNRLRIRHLISGSVAAMLYGEPRLTNGIDLIVDLPIEDVARLTEAYPPAEFYVPPAEVITLEASREQRGQFNVISSSLGLKADFYLAGRDPLHAWAFQNARDYLFEGTRVRLAPPEYVIVRKLEYFREGGSEKHLRDIRAMLAVSSEQLGRGALGDGIDRRGLAGEWQRASS